MSKPTRLGRGLESLLGPRKSLIDVADADVEPQTRPIVAETRETPEAPAQTIRPGIVPGGPTVLPPRPTPKPAETLAVQSISVDAIDPNPNQPRSTFDDAALQELAASVRVSGVIQPILVRAKALGRFELVAGERRWRAAKLAGFTVIPAIVRALTDAQSLEIALVENLQRADLNPLERAVAYNRYIQTFRSSADLLAVRLGESRANIVNYVRLLRLPDEVREMVGSGQLGFGQARALLAVPKPERQLAIARMAVRRNLSVRQVEELTQTGESPAAAERRATARDEHVTQVESMLSKAIGVKVSVRPGRLKNTGSLVLRYGSLEEFERITERLGGSMRLE
jgi:ParB family transcriptional regulator, chromosome partitioning protein